MRITLNIDDALAKVLKKKAHRTGKSFEKIINETLEAGLRKGQKIQPTQYRLKVSKMGVELREVELDKALELAAELEDLEITGKMKRNK